MPKRQVIAQAEAQAGKLKVRVALVRRPGRKNLWLTWLDPKLRNGKGDYAYRDLGHEDEGQGEDESRQLAALLLSARGGAQHDVLHFLTGLPTHPPLSAATPPATSADASSGVSTLPVEYQGQSLTLGELFSLYESARIDPPAPGMPPRKSHKQRTSDLHRMELWQQFATSACPVLSIDPDTVYDYTGWRRSQGMEDTTIGHEIGFLKGVFNWATKKRGPTGLPLMLFNPIGDLKRIRSVEPNAPVAEESWFVRVYRMSDRADPRGLLRCMMMLCFEHGWRLTAWCHLWASDIDFTRSELFPYGRVRKRSENEKANKIAAKRGKVGKKTKWVPLTPLSRSAAMRLLRRSQAIGNTFVFRAPRGGGPWQDYYALGLLHKAELLVCHPERLKFLGDVAAQVGDRVTIRKGRGSFSLEQYLARHGKLLTRDIHHTARWVARVNEEMGWEWRAALEPEKGRGFHSLRRKWGSDRKDEPLVDVAYAGDWHPGTLLNFYQREDPKTTLRVVLGGRKKRNLGPLSDQPPVEGRGLKAV
jgi:hypothetical protein